MNQATPEQQLYLQQQQLQQMQQQQLPQIEMPVLSEENLNQMSEEELQQVLEHQQQLMLAQQYQQQLQMQQFMKQQTSVTKKGNSLRPKSAKNQQVVARATKPKGIAQTYANFYQPYAGAPGLKKKSTFGSQSMGGLKAVKGKKKKKRTTQMVNQNPFY